jgi:hypothetical protein
MIESIHFLILIVFIALWEKLLKHEGREDVQRTRRKFMIFRVLRILHIFVFQNVFSLMLTRRVNVFLILVVWRGKDEGMASSQFG